MRGNGKAAVMIGGSLFRTINSRSWDAERRLPDMEEEASPLKSFHRCRNCYLTGSQPRMQTFSPTTLINRSRNCVSPSRAISLESEWCQCRTQHWLRADWRQSDPLGLCGVEIGTHIAGVPLGDARLNEFCARCHVAAHSRGHRTVSATAHIAQPWRRGLALDTSSAAADARVGSFFARTFRSRTRRDGAPILLRYDPL